MACGTACDLSDRPADRGRPAGGAGRLEFSRCSALLHACAVSIASATTATLIIALGGIPLGYLLARLPGRAMATVGFLVQLPLALPPLASGILLLFLVGYSSPIGRLTSGALTDSFAGIVVAEVFVAAPFLIIAARSAFASIDPVLEGVAATLGRRPLYVFFRVSASNRVARDLVRAIARLAACVRRIRRHCDGRLSPLFAAGLHLRRLSAHRDFRRCCRCCCRQLSLLWRSCC